MEMNAFHRTAGTPAPTWSALMEGLTPDEADARLLDIILTDAVGTDLYWDPVSREPQILVSEPGRPDREPLSLSTRGAQALIGQLTVMLDHLDRLHHRLEQEQLQRL